jgi:hypothetical protein
VAVEAKRRPDAGKRLLRVAAGEVVVPAAGTDAADLRLVQQERLVHRPGVVIEPAADRQVHPQPAVRNPGRPEHPDHLPQVRHSLTRLVVVGEPAVELVQDVGVRPGRLGQGDDLGGLLRAHAGLPTHLLDDLLRPDLAQLVQRPQQGRRLPLQPELGEKAIQDPAVVDPDLEPVEAEGDEQVVDDERDLDVGGVRQGADGVEVALHELAEPAGLRALAPPDGPEVIPLERQAQFGEVLRHEPGERDREVEPQRDVPVAGVLESVELLVDLRSGLDLGQQHLGQLDGRGVDGGEAVGAVDLAGGLHEPLAGDHEGRRVVAEALEDAGLDQLRHGRSRNGKESGVRRQ